MGKKNQWITAPKTLWKIQRLISAKKKSQESETDDRDSIATEHLLGETIDDSHVLDDPHVLDEDEACGDAVIEKKAEDDSEPEEKEVGEKVVEEEKETEVEKPEAQQKDTQTLCVGPIWSHDDFLSRQQELTEIGKEKLGEEYEIEGNWWSENCTSYVMYQKCQLIKPEADQVELAQPELEQPELEQIEKQQETEAQLPSEPCIAPQLNGVIECSEDLSQEKREAVKMAVCEDYDEEGEHSFALPPDRDQFTHPGLEVIEENEPIEIEENNQEEEADSTRPVNIPIRNDDFFDEDEPEVKEVPITVQEEPVHKPTFTPIQARNEAMNMKKVPDQSKSKSNKNQLQKQLEAPPNMQNFMVIGSVVIILAAVAIRFLS